MKNNLHDIFAVDKFVIGGVHLKPLPGTPGYDESAGIAAIIAAAREEATRLVEGGIDGLIFTNEADLPYEQRVGPEITAAFTRVVMEATAGIGIPFGINVLLDPVAAMAVAQATGASFVRGYFSGTYVGDTALMDSRGAEALRFRRRIGAGGVAIIANATCGFGASLDPRGLGDVVRGMLAHGLIDAVAVNLAAGREVAREALIEAREAACGTPVLVGTGLSKENATDLLGAADGAIVASSIKVDGRTLNPVDLTAVRDLMAAVRRVRKAR